mmetsp:Transcript_18742/g.43529  ORF Transcript_18742/g.43529 Transcript_18742/m.43529 type:complete len:80 (-) Transcript_18742:1800-2039(-)
MIAFRDHTLEEPPYQYPSLLKRQHQPRHWCAVTVAEIDPGKCCNPAHCHVCSYFVVCRLSSAGVPCWPLSRKNASTLFS